MFRDVAVPSLVVQFDTTTGNHKINHSIESYHLVLSHQAVHSFVSNCGPRLQLALIHTTTFGRLPYYMYNYLAYVTSDVAISHYMCNV